MKKSAVYVALAIILMTFVNAQEQPAFFSATSTIDMEPTPSIGGLIEPDIQVRQERLEEAVPSQKPEAVKQGEEVSPKDVVPAAAEQPAKVSLSRLLIVAVGLLAVIAIAIFIIKRGASGGKK
jgi:hypothetical protein